MSMNFDGFLIKVDDEGFMDFDECDWTLFWWRLMNVMEFSWMFNEFWWMFNGFWYVILVFFNF